jgi:hypothetical protein
VGENAGIYEITPAGQGKQIFKTKDNHVLCLKLTPRGIFWPAAGDEGLVYKISGSKSSVLFESPYEEIRAIDLDGGGNIYLTTSGQPSKPVAAAASSAASVQSKSETDVSIVVTASQIEAVSSEIGSSRVSDSKAGRVSGLSFRFLLRV